MVTYLPCETCDANGEVPTGAGGYMECDQCVAGYVAHPSLWDRVYDRLPRPIAWRINRTHRAYRKARHLWINRSADVVGHVLSAHRGVLDDQPRLQAMVDTDLRLALQDETPLYWRIADARWALHNAKRALRGLPAEAPPWDEIVDITVHQDDRDFFERNVLAIRGERRRRPRRG